MYHSKKYLLKKLQTFSKNWRINLKSRTSYGLYEKDFLEPRWCHVMFCESTEATQQCFTDVLGVQEDYSWGLSCSNDMPITKISVNCTFATQLHHRSKFHNHFVEIRPKDWEVGLSASIKQPELSPMTALQRARLIDDSLIIATKPLIYIFFIFLKRDWSWKDWTPAIFSILLLLPICRWQKC